MEFVPYRDETQLPLITRLIERDLSEPYSVYTYRFFLNAWPELCLLAMDGGECVGVVVCKLERHRNQRMRGYIAMLAVDQAHRHKRIGSTLVVRAIERMRQRDCDEVVLEAEVSNTGALALYERLGFVRDKRLYRYYLSGTDAFRLKLWLTPPLPAPVA